MATTKQKLALDKSRVEIPKPKGWDKRDWVYVVECNGKYKIGKTSQPETRIPLLSTGNPEDITTYGLWRVHNALEIEQSLHELFRPKNVRGEWFKLDQIDLQLLEMKLNAYAMI